MSDVNFSARILNYAKINKVSEEKAKEILEKEDESKSDESSSRILTYNADDESLQQIEYLAEMNKLQEKNKIETIPHDDEGNIGAKINVNRSFSGSSIEYTYDAATNTLKINATKCAIEIVEIDEASASFDPETFKIELSGMNVKLNSNVQVKGGITSSALNCIINGSDENDNITATGMNTTINAGKGDDTVITRGMRSTIRGGQGADTINAYGMYTSIFAGNNGESENANDKIDARGMNIYVDAGKGESEAIVHGVNIVVDTNIAGNKKIEGFGNDITVQSGYAANDIVLGGQKTKVEYEQSETVKPEETPEEKQYSPADNITINREKINERDTNYDEDGYNADGYNAQGFKRPENEGDKPLNFNGYDADGYDVNGIDREGRINSEIFVGNKPEILNLLSLPEDVEIDEKSEEFSDGKLQSFSITKDGIKSSYEIRYNGDVVDNIHVDTPQSSTTHYYQSGTKTGYVQINKANEFAVIPNVIAKSFSGEQETLLYNIQNIPGMTSYSGIEADLNSAVVSFGSNQITVESGYGLSYNDGVLVAAKLIDADEDTTTYYATTGALAQNVIGNKLYSAGKIEKATRVVNHDLFINGEKQTTNRDNILALSGIAVNDISAEVYTGTKLSEFRVVGNRTLVYTVNYDEENVSTIEACDGPAPGAVGGAIKNTTYYYSDNVLQGSIAVTTQVRDHYIPEVEAKDKDGNVIYSVDFMTETQYRERPNPTLDGLTLKFGENEINVVAGDRVTYDEAMGKIKVTNGDNTKLYNVDGTEYVAGDDTVESDDEEVTLENYRNVTDINKLGSFLETLAVNEAPAISSDNTSAYVEYSNALRDYYEVDSYISTLEYSALTAISPVTQVDETNHLQTPMEDINNLMYVNSKLDDYYDRLDKEGANYWGIDIEMIDDMDGELSVIKYYNTGAMKDVNADFIERNEDGLLIGLLNDENSYDIQVEYSENNFVSKIIKNGILEVSYNRDDDFNVTNVHYKNLKTKAEADIVIDEYAKIKVTEIKTDTLNTKFDGEYNVLNYSYNIYNSFYNHSCIYNPNNKTLSLSTDNSAHLYSVSGNLINDTDITKIYEEFMGTKAILKEDGSYWYNAGGCIYPSIELHSYSDTMLDLFSVTFPDDDELPKKHYQFDSNKNLLKYIDNSGEVIYTAEYYDNGDIKSQENTIVRKSWHENGQLFRNYRLNSSQDDLDDTTWYSNGKISSVHRDGDEDIYAEDGTFTSACRGATYYIYRRESGDWIESGAGHWDVIDDHLVYVEKVVSEPSPLEPYIVDIAIPETADAEEPPILVNVRETITQNYAGTSNLQTKIEFEEWGDSIEYRYDESGRCLSENAFYDNGNLKSKKVYDTNGLIKDIQAYKNGKIKSIQEYDDNGNLTNERQYSEDGAIKYIKKRNNDGTYQEYSF